MPEHALVLSAGITTAASGAYDFKRLFLMLMLCIGLPDTLVDNGLKLSSV
jgi:hypothetical protein